MPKCNNPKCSTSTGICGALTFGSGKLDEYGYWEIPCLDCAEDFQKSQPELIRELTREYKARGEKYNPQNHEWLYLTPWPLP